MTARSDMAGAVREALTMEQVARRYGFEPDRAGFIRCPFHRGDRTASLKLYPGRRGFHCFGCGRGGSVIDFVMELYGIGFAQALVRLNSDFGLGLTGRRPDPVARSRALEERRRAQAERERLLAQYGALAKEHLYWLEAQKYFAPGREGWEAGVVHPLWLEAVRRLPGLEWEIEEWEANYGRAKDRAAAGGAA